MESRFSSDSAAEQKFIETISGLSGTIVTAWHTVRKRIQTLQNAQEPAEIIIEEAKELIIPLRQKIQAILGHMWNEEQKRPRVLENKNYIELKQQIRYTQYCIETTLGEFESAYRALSRLLELPGIADTTILNIHLDAFLCKRNLDIVAPRDFQVMIYHLMDALWLGYHIQNNHPWELMYTAFNRKTIQPELILRALETVKKVHDVDISGSLLVNLLLLRSPEYEKEAKQKLWDLFDAGNQEMQNRLKPILLVKSVTQLSKQILSHAAPSTPTAPEESL